MRRYCSVREVVGIIGFGRLGGIKYTQMFYCDLGPDAVGDLIMTDFELIDIPNKFLEFWNTLNCRSK